MLAHLLDHFVFSSRRFSLRTKQIVFGVCVFTIVGTFWWFKGVAFGIDGPINDHWGLKWRSVRLRLVVRLPRSELTAVSSCRIGTYIMSNYRISMSSSTSSLSLSMFRIRVLHRTPTIYVFLHPGIPYKDLYL